jgi:hypothetical protein
LQCFSIAQHISGDTPPFIRSSKTVIAASGFTYVFLLPASAIAEPSQRPVNRPDDDQQHCYHHTPTVKPEVATAVVEILVMGVRTPETC